VSRTKSTIPRPSVEDLRRLYIDEHLGCPEIGRMFERDPKTVFWWLRQAGIPTRQRGSDPRQHFKKGERSAYAGRRHTPESIAKVRAATIADGRIPYMRDGKHWLKGAPPEMNPRWKGGATPERQAFYRTPEWKAAVRAVWHRADAKCERCGLDHRGVDRATMEFHVHHIVSFQVKELRAVLSNLVLLCEPCHTWIHSNQNVDRAFIQDARRGD
jgi:5-methylcytosine-specific restriction endonuclease McrA